MIKTQISTMKHITYLLLILTLAVVSSCSNDDEGVDTCSPNSINDPATQIGWINQMIIDNANTQDDAQILCYEYNGGLVFLVDLCVNCNNGFTVYDCDQATVCSNDQNGNDSCANLINGFTNEIVVWRNF